MKANVLRMTNFKKGTIDQYTKSTDKLILNNTYFIKYIIRYNKTPANSTHKFIQYFLTNCLSDHRFGSSGWLIKSQNNLGF